MLFFKFARFTPPTPTLINRKSDDMEKVQLLLFFFLAQFPMVMFFPTSLKTLNFRPGLGQQSPSHCKRGVCS